MKCFMKNQFCSGAADSSELKAVLFALLACFLFIGFLTAATRSKQSKRRYVVNDHTFSVPPPPPVRPAQVPPVTAELPPPPPLDPNARFRIAPRNFERIDFKNRSYGNYTLSDGANVDLALINGQFREYARSNHWFDFSDVFYADLTGDGSAEAIVLLSHLECGHSCDGGKNLIYIYSLNNLNGFSEILRYETGSGQDGCSMKSLTVKNRRLSFELFGKCPQPKETVNDPTRRETYDVTRVDFRFNGERLLEAKKTHLSVRDCNEVSWGVEIRIGDERSPAAVTSLSPAPKGSRRCA